MEGTKSSNRLCLQPNPFLEDNHQDLTPPTLILKRLQSPFVPILSVDENLFFCTFRYRTSEVEFFSFH